VDPELQQINADESAAMRLMAEMSDKLTAAKGSKEALKRRFIAFEESQEAPLKAARRRLEDAQRQKEQFGWIPFTNYDADVKTAAVAIIDIITGAPRTHARTHTHILSHTHAYTRTHSRSLARTHARTNARAHARRRHHR
jgi:hypothetical protein